MAAQNVDNVRLHVVYSGRGDAMYLTWRTMNQPQLLMMFLIDGGPYSYLAQNTNPAPYWKYLVWAGKQIWQSIGGQGDRFNLNAIFNTHQHDDHLAGLTQMIKEHRSLEDKSFMNFQGPFFVPAYYEATKDKDGKELKLSKAVESVWKPLIQGSSELSEDARYVPWKNEPGVNTAINIPAGIHMHLPNLDNIIQMAPYDVTPEETRKAAEDRKYRKAEDFQRWHSKTRNLNFKSMIMETDFQDQNAQGHLFFTGDNKGEKIKDFVKDQHFTIYKIQHHGSRDDNSMIYGIGESTPAIIRQEMVLLFTLLVTSRLRLERQLSNIPVYVTAFVNQQIRELRKEANWKKAFAYLENQIQVQADLKIKDMQKYVEALLERHYDFHRQYLECKTPTQNYKPDARKNLGDFPKKAQQPAVVWRNIENHVLQLRGGKKKDFPSANQRGWDNVDDRLNKLERNRKGETKPSKKPSKKGSKEPDDPPTKDLQDPKHLATLHLFYNTREMRSEGRDDPHVPDEREWWQKWMHKSVKWKLPFGKIQSVNSIAAFFSSFRSEAYVVSTNHAQYNHPHPETILGLALALRSQNRKATLYMTSAHSFRPAALRKLKIGRDDSGDNLTGLLYGALEVRYLAKDTHMSLMGKPCQDEAERDLNRVTEALQIEGAAEEAYKLLHDQMENKIPLPDVNQSKRWFSIYTIAAEKKQYLSVSNNVLVVNLLATNANKWFVSRPDVTAAGKTFQDIDMVSAGTALEVRIGRSKIQKELPELRGWQLLQVRDSGFFSLTLGNDGVSTEWALTDLAVDNIQPFYFELCDPPPETGEMAPLSPVKMMSILWRPLETSLTHRSLDKPLMDGVLMNMLPLPSLRDFINTSKNSLSETSSGTDTLSMLVQRKNLDRLGLVLSYQKSILSYQVDLDKSTVDFKGNDLSRGFSAASISLKVPENAIIELGGNELALLSASIEVMWDLDLRLKVDCVVQTEPNILIQSHSETAGAMGRPSLAKVLDGMGVAPAVSAEITIPQLLVFLLQNDGMVEWLLAEKLPTAFVSAGLPLIKPDLDRSTALVSYLPGNQIVASEAEIICTIEGVADWTSAWSIAGLSLTVDSLRILLSDISTSDETVRFMASASFRSSQSGLKLSAQFILEGEESPELVFFVSGTNSLDELARNLPNVPSFGDKPIPLSKDLSVKDLSDSMSGLGFTISQPASQIPQYSLISVFATVRFSDWKDFLPANIAPKIVHDATTQLIIRNPLEVSRRAVAIGVNLELAISRPAGVGEDDTLKYVRFNFTAEPAPGLDEYDFRFSTEIDGNGFSLTEAAAVLGLQDLTHGTQSAMPVLATSVLNDVFVRRLSIGVEQRGGGWAFGDWLLDLWVENLDDVFPTDKVSFYDIYLSIGQTRGLIHCTGRGALYFPKPDIVVNFGFDPPRRDLPGTFYIKSPEGLSFSDLLVSFDLPTFEDVPVVKEILDIYLLSAILDVTEVDIPDKPSSWEIYSGRAQFGMSEKLVGVLGLNSLLFSVDYNRSDSPFGLGEAQIFFDVDATMLDDRLAAELRYDSSRGLFSASLKPVTSLTLADPLATILPTSLSDIVVPFLGGLDLQKAELVLVTKEPYSVKSFELNLLDESTLVVEILQLRSLEIKYVAAQPIKINGNAVSGLPNGTANEVLENGTANGKIDPELQTTSALLDVVGTLSKGTTRAKLTIHFTGKTGDQGPQWSIGIQPESKGSLALSGMLSLVGLADTKSAVEEPPNCPSFLDLQVEDISGTVTKHKNETTQQSELFLQEFYVAVQSQGTLQILSEPQVALDSLKVNLTYERFTDSVGKREARLHGYIQGHIILCGVDVWVAYVKSKVKDVSYFLGSASLAGKPGASNKPYGFADLGSSVAITPDDYEIPADLKVPSDLKFLSVTGLFVPEKRFDIYAQCGEIWKGQCVGVDIEIKSMQALLRRISRVNPKTGEVESSSEAFLHGELAFGEFGCVNAWLVLSKKRNSTLTATWTPKDTSSGVEALTTQVASDDQADKFWANLVPKTNVPFNFEATGLFLFVDFKTSKFVLSGQITGLGSALLMAKKRKDSDKRDYLFILEAHDLARIWTSTSADVVKQFDIEKVSVQVISYDTTIKQLREDIDTETATAVDPAPDPVIKNRNLAKKAPQPLDTEAVDVHQPASPPAPTTSNKAILAVHSAVDLLPADTPLRRGAWFFAIVSLANPEQQQPMTSVLQFGLQPAATPRARITVFAAMTADATARQYGIDVRDLVLWGGHIEINGHGVYKPAEGLVDVQARLALRGLLGGDEKRAILFDVAFQKKKGWTHFEVGAKGAGDGGLAEVSEPFGGMFAVRLKELKISGTITQPEGQAALKSEYVLTGEAEIGKLRKNLAASVLFTDGKPMAAYLKYGAADQVSFTEISSDIIRPDGSGLPLTWRTDQYDDFSLTSVQMCYVSGNDVVTVDSLAYKPGFTIAATFNVFDHGFMAELLLDPQRKGFVLSAIYLGEIDLFFARLVKTPKIKGPTISIKALEGRLPITFIAESGLTLFGEPGFSFSVAYRPASDPKNRFFEGKASYAGTILGKKNPEVTFTYKNGRWGFSGWEMFKELEDFPLEKAIELGSAKDRGCGAIVGLVWKTLIKTKFRFEIGLPIDANHKSSAEGIWGSMRWWYNIKFLDEEIVDLPLPHIDIKIPGPFTLESLATKLFDIVMDKENWESIGAAIMERPEDFGRLMAAVAFESMGENLATIICRGTKYGDPKGRINDRAKEINDKKFDDASKKIDNAISEAAKAIEAASLGGGAAALMEAEDLLTLIGTSLAALFGAGTIVAIIMKGDDEKQKKRLKDEEARLLKKLEEAKKKVEEAKQRIRRALTLSANPAAQFIVAPNDESTISVDWTNALPNSTGYDYQNFKDISWEVRYESQGIRPDELVDIMHPAISGHTTDRASDPRWTFVKVVSIYVRARLKKEGIEDLLSEEWKRADVTHIPWLQAPDDFSFDITPETAVVAIPPTMQDVGNYELVLTNAERFASGNYLFSTRLAKAGMSSERITIGLERLGSDARDHKSIQAYLRQVVSKSAAMHDSPWLAFPTTWSVRAAPTNLSVKMEDSKLLVQWTQAGSPFDQDYTLRILRENGTAAPTATLAHLPADPGQRRVSLDGLSFSHRETLTVAVQQQTASQTAELALTAVASFTVLYPPTPAVSPSTCYDAVAGLLSVVVRCDTPVLAVETSLAYKLTLADGGDVVEGVAEFVTVGGCEALARIAVPREPEDGPVHTGGSLLAPLVARVEVAMVNKAARNPASAVVVFAPLPEREVLRLGKEGEIFRLVMMGDGGVRVVWPPGGSGAKRLVSIEHESSLTEILGAEWNSEQDGHLFSKEDCTKLSEGMRVAVYRTVRAKDTNGQRFIDGERERQWVTLNREGVAVPSG